jgi:hypothetical protein
MSLSIRLLIVFLVSAQPVFAQADPESIEPPVGYSLKVGDKVVRLKEREPAVLDGTFTNPKITLTADDYRVFPYAGVSFQYPSDFAFQAELDDKNLRRWSLDGKNCVIMVQEYGVKIELDDLVNAIAKQYGEGNSVQTEISLTLGGRKLDGKRIKAKLAGSTIVQDVLAIPTTKGAKVMLLQDSPNDDGTPSEERRLLEKRLVESFAFTKK